MSHRIRTRAVLLLAAGCAAAGLAAPAAAAADRGRSGAAAAQGAAAAVEVTTRRLAGPDRYATAVAIARASFPDGPDNIVVARGDDFPDALSAVNLIGGYWGDGAVLLTPFANLPTSTRGYLRDFGRARLYATGTTEVLSTRVEAQMDSYGPSPSRFGGRDRYETMRATYEFGYMMESNIVPTLDGKRTAFLASGATYADAISVGPVAFAQSVPVALTAPDHLPAATRAALSFLRELEQVVIIGGPNAVSPAVEAAVAEMGLTVRRVAGANRQETAVRVFELAESAYGWKATHVNLVRGDGFADALAGAPHAGSERAPLLLTANARELGAVTEAFLRARAGTISSLDVLGSNAAVSDSVVARARAAATP